MKKVICHQIRTLSDEEAMSVNGGSRRSDALNTAISGDRGCGAGARDTRGSGNKTTHHGGCNSRSHSGGSGGGKSRVICTHFYQKGMLDKKVWRADLEFTQQNLSSTTVRGYHFWAIRYVELMRENANYEKVMYPIAKYRAIELAHQMGVVEKGSIRGKVIRAIIEPTCFMIGLFCSQKDWQKLWANS